MTFDEYLADRIRNTLKTRQVVFEEKLMFGGICFMIDDKMTIDYLRHFNLHLDEIDELIVS